MTQSKTATFFLRGGHVIALNNIKGVEMTRDMTNGRYTGYHIEWVDPKHAPALLTMSIPDIVAVMVADDK